MSRFKRSQPYLRPIINRIPTAGSANTSQNITGKADIRGTTAQIITGKANMLGLWKSKVSVWMYPGAPACNANTEYADGRVLDMIKAEYYKVDPAGTGALIQKTTGTDGCNGYSAANAADVVQNCWRPIVNVSCRLAANMDALCSSSVNRAAAIATLLAFLRANSFAGVELDWEDYHLWTAGQYTNYKTFVNELGTALHAAGYILILDGPPITAITDSVNGQNLYAFTYEDFNSLPVDIMCVLAYDKEYDYGGGTSISPTAFVQAVCDWMIAKVTTPQIQVGLPSYGYSASDGLYNINILTYDQVSPITGFSGATRNADYEMNWQVAPGINASGIISSGATSKTLASNWVLPSGQYTVTFSNGNVRVATLTNGAATMTWVTGLTSGATATLTWTPVDIFYQDSSGLNSKRIVIENKGILLTSVYHIGGNQWFAATYAEPTPLQALRGLSRITATTLKTNTGKADIRATTSRTESGVARIQKSASQTIAGLSRVQTSVAQTVTAKSRIQKSVSQTETAVSRITATTSQTISAKGDIRKNTLQTINALSRIQLVVPKTETGISRIQKSVSQTQQALSRITATTVKTETGVARMQKNATQTETGVARVQKTVTQAEQGLSRIQKSVAQTETGKSRMQVSVSQTTTAKARVTATAQQTEQGKGRIQKTASQTESGVSRVQRVITQTQAGLSRITGTTVKTETGVGNIRGITTRTNTGKGRLQKTGSQTLSGKSSIVANTTKRQVTVLITRTRKHVLKSKINRPVPITTLHKIVV